MTIELEITAHRFGGEDNYPRDFRQESVNVDPENEYTHTRIDCTTTARLWLSLTLSAWTLAHHEWVGCTAQLADINGSPLGRRPLLIFDRPYDVPTHTNFGSRHPDAGTFVVAVRRTR